MKPLFVYLLKDTETLLWGLSGRSRLQRMLEAKEGVALVEALEQIPDESTVLLLLSDYLYDPRLLANLLSGSDQLALKASASDDIVAVRIAAGDASQARQELSGESEASLLVELPSVLPEELVKAYDARLLKYDPPEILAINEANKKQLENELFNGSYKGITDIVTKWLWPVPAKAVVRFCVKQKITANQVTLLSLVLAILAGVAFAYGFLISGLIMGWLMTFLDTVDGKLARVTVSSSKIGDILDHGLDLIHPPLWYLAWASGIAGVWMSPALVMPLFWIILVAYIGGRLCEGAFDLWVASFRLFLWQPFDSYNRLITARRNPNMVLLTTSLIFDRPDLGLYAVAVWHVLSTIILFGRVLMAVKEKKRVGELETWLNTIDPLNDRNRLEVRLFTRLSKSR